MTQEIVPLRKICRRPETDYRLQQLHAMNDSYAEQRKSASSADHMKSIPAIEQHKIVSSVEQVKTDVDASSSKEGISNSVTLSDQKPHAPISLGNTSSISEAPICSSNNQLSRPEVINLDPETDVENADCEVQDATDDMAVDEPLEKETDIMPDATAEKTDCLPMFETASIVAQNESRELVSQAPQTDGTEHAPNASQVDSDPMIVEMSMPTDDGKTNVDHDKDELISATDADLTQEAVILLPRLPSDAWVSEADVDVFKVIPNVGNITLEENILETPVTTSIEAGKSDIDSNNATPADTCDDADPLVYNSDPSTPQTTIANTENYVEKNDGTT